MKQQTHARVYRFHDTVAFSTDDSKESAYLSPTLAREFAALLLAYAMDVQTVTFVDSELGTRYAGRRDIDDAREIKAVLDAEAAALFVCGTRRAFRKGPRDFRVVCATCDAGGSVKHATQEGAHSAAVRDSGRACRTCGAD